MEHLFTEAGYSMLAWNFLGLNFSFESCEVAKRSCDVTASQTARATTTLVVWQNSTSKESVERSKFLVVIGWYRQV